MTVKNDKSQINIRFVSAIRDRLIELDVRDATEAFFEHDEIDVEFEKVLTERPELDRVEFLREGGEATRSRPANLSTFTKSKGWLSRLPSLESISGSYFGASGGAFADSGNITPKQEKSRDLFWKQDELLLTLRSSGKNRLEVLLDIEGSLEGYPAVLSWVDEGILDQGSQKDVPIVSYPITRNPSGSYSIAVPSGAYVRRMRLIDAVEEGRLAGEVELSILLPFVEFSE
jgi:hypothetical protein